MSQKRYKHVTHELSPTDKKKKHFTNVTKKKCYTHVTHELIPTTYTLGIMSCVLHMCRAIKTACLGTTM